MGDGTGWVWILAGALVAVIVVTGVVLYLYWRKRDAANSRSDSRPQSLATTVHERVWIVVNPSKLNNYLEFRRKVSAAVMAATKKPAMWIETTVEDPGTGQTIHALDQQPSLVLAAGGDGTVRAVAAGMSHAGVPMGILPMGTGNLLARNLSIPLDLDEALAVALFPFSRSVDLAWLSMERVTEPPSIPAEGHLLRRAGAPNVRHLPEGVEEPGDDEFAFAVIAGVGFDGETMAHTRPELKKRVGWSAYVFTALRSLRIDRMRATVTIYHSRKNEQIGIPHRKSGRIPSAVEVAVRESHTLGARRGTSSAAVQDEWWDMTSIRARSILFANCGELPFAVLAPDAVIDDGALDVVVIDTRAGLIGWSYLAAKIFAQGLGLMPVNVKYDPGTIQFRQTHASRVDLSRPYPVQVDGDAIGSARTILARVDKGALEMRVPRD